MIKCVMFCEFDVNFGPILTYQYPQYMSKEVFGELSDYLIPLPELCGKLVTSHINDEDFVVGQPIIIFNEKYDRRKLEFNLAFVLAHEEYQRLPIYENLIRKIAMHLTMLETFDGFLYDKSRKACLEQICEKIYKDLTAGEPQCYLVFDELNVLTLDYEKKDFLLPPLIKDYAVPVPLANLEIFSSLTHDFNVQSVILAIDGKKCVKQIRETVNLTESKIILCLKHLYYQGIIDFIDLFQVTNIYRVTSKISLLLNDEQIKEEAVNHLAKTTDVTHYDIFEYYTELSYKVLSDFLEENPVFIAKFDIELFIAYGVLKGIIKRVHKYCIETQNKNKNMKIRDSVGNVNEMNALGMLGGNVPLDHICTHFMMEQRSIEGKLKDIGVIFSK